MLKRSSWLAAALVASTALTAAAAPDPRAGAASAAGSVINELRSLSPQGVAAIPDVGQGEEVASRPEPPPRPGGGGDRPRRPCSVRLPDSQIFALKRPGRAFTEEEVKERLLKVCAGVGRCRGAESFSDIAGRSLAEAGLGDPFAWLKFRNTMIHIIEGHDHGHHPSAPIAPVAFNPARTFGDLARALALAQR